jgi:branched-chain amino acid transport system ATP-binding protein
MQQKEVSNRMSERILSVENISCSYGAINALTDFSLEVNAGELVSLCGVNGAGKSTTLKAIAGVIKPTQGSIIFKDEPTAGKSPEVMHKKGVALVPEGRDIFPSLTVAENLRIGVFGMFDRKQYAEDLEDMFALFPILKERYNQAGGHLSGGEQQMLAIARGLVSRPDLLMLDEPSLGLSPNMVDNIFELILQLKSRGTTILLVEQNVERALKLADRAYLLSTGHCAFAGKPADLNADMVQSVYLGSNAATAAGNTEKEAN